MSNGIEAFAAAAAKSNADAMALLGKLFQVAEPGAVFSTPVISGDHTVITASEISIGMGLGFGSGGGEPTEKKAEAATGEESKDNAEGSGGGGGGGGGGFSAGRPVAAVIISPTAVRVEPIVDVTKISIAFFTALGAMFMAWRAMRSFGR